jgi:phytoene dehydrogenase-like protein
MAGLSVSSCPQKQIHFGGSSRKGVELLEFEYDGVIIGAGPNSLALAAYLSKAGQKVILLERRFEAGGGLMTEEVTLPGYYHNTHAVYHMMVDYAPVFKDIDLTKYGLQWLYPPLQFAMPFSDGSSLCLYSDVDKTCSSIAKFSQKDAESYRKMYDKYNVYMEEFVGPATYHEAIPAFEQMMKLQSTDIGKEISELTEQTPREIIEGTFEHDKVRAMLLYVTCMWGLDYDMQGLGYLVPLYVNRSTNYRLCVGGSHKLAHCLYRSIYDNDHSMVLTSQLIKRIIVENGEAKGVEMEDGRVFWARNFVCSGIDPYQTFIDYVGENNLSSEFVTRVHDYQWEWESLLDVHMALEEAPRFTAAASNPDVDQSFVYILGYESEQELIDHWEAIKRGELVVAGFNACFPTVHDPTEAPPGKHTGLISEAVPYDLKDGGADRYYNYKFKEEHAQQLLNVLRKYAPNMNEDTVLWTYIGTPKDYENKFWDMKKGSYKQGGYFPLQMGYLRPNEDCSHHRTPVKNLYLCGASVFPGGCVIWGPGYNAANRIAEDYGIEKWWPKMDIVTQAEEKGLL